MSRSTVYRYYYYTREKGGRDQFPDYFLCPRRTQNPLGESPITQKKLGLLITELTRTQVTQQLSNIVPHCLR